MKEVQLKKIEDKILELNTELKILVERKMKYENIMDEKNPESIYFHREYYDDVESWENDIEWYDSQLEYSIPNELSNLNQWLSWLVELLEQNNIVTQKIELLSNQLKNYKWFGNEEDEDYKEEYGLEYQHLIDEQNYWISLKEISDKKTK